MLELKNFPFQLHKRVSFSKKEKEKKKILLKLRNNCATYFPRRTCNFYPNNFTFFFFPLSLPSPFPCATEWQSTFLKVGLELFGERLTVESSTGRERKNTRLLCWIARPGRIPRSTRKTRKFSFEPPFIFSPRAPHLFIHLSRRSPPPFSTRFFHLLKEGENRTPVEFLIPLGPLSTLGRAFLNYFRFVGNVCWTKGRFEASV